MVRSAPTITDRTRAYWTSGSEGVLRISRCGTCGFYIHPPKPVCPQCRGEAIAFEPVSGDGVVDSFTVNRYQWKPGMTPPYVIAEVELAEQKGLLVMTNIEGCEIDDVRVGMKVHVAFDHVDDAWIPVFRP